MPVSVDKLTATYFKIKSKRDQIRSEYTAQDEKLKIQQDKIKDALAKHCKENEVDSVRTPHGTFFRQVKKKFWTRDWDSMYKFIVEHEVPEFFNKQLNQSNVQQFLDENPDLYPPGLNVDSEYVITVRKAAKK